MSKLRHKVYVWAKIAKANAPLVRRRRLLKTSDRVTHYGGRKILDASAGNSYLLKRLSMGVPTAAGKIGDTELEVLLKFDRYRHDPVEFFRSVTVGGHELDLLHLNSGVFPKEQHVLVRWAQVYLDALSRLDVLGVWFNKGEEEIVVKYAPAAALTRIRALEPYYHSPPWTHALAGRRVAVVSPFEHSIMSQRGAHTGIELFPDMPMVFPDFELTVIRSPFSAALVRPDHATWHEALSDIQSRLAAAQFDVCLVGAGAYSLPICSFVRDRLGQSAIHLGGPLQLLFGIRGNRWEQHPVISRFFNNNWIKPLPRETPRANWRNDGGAYW
jgi:hypothetical protein